jgi:hypothetical protein
MVNTEIFPWDMLFGLVNARLRYLCGQLVFSINLSTVLVLLVVGMGAHRRLPQLKLNVP